MPRTTRFAKTILLAAGCAAAVLPWSAAHPQAGAASQAATCPVPAGVDGYPVAVEAPGVPEVGPDHLARLADAVARRWETPSPGRRQYAGLLHRVRRLRTPAPLWTDDWSPDDRHVASLAATLHRDGRVGAVTVLTRTGDRLFDGSLASIFARPTAEPALPPFPPELSADTLRIVVHLGEVPAGGGAGVVRFAAQQAPVRVVPGTLRVIPPPSARGRSSAGRPSAVASYDVDERGVVVPGSIEVLRSSDPGLARAVHEGLSRARFVPAEADCQPIARTVVQRFGDG